VEAADWLESEAENGAYSLRIRDTIMNKLISQTHFSVRSLITAVLVILFQGVQPVQAISEARADTGRPGVNTLHGMRIYNKVCAQCHDEGKNGAPALDDLTDWRKRIFQGEEVLDQHAMQGYLKMPAKGGHPELSDQDIIDAVHYIIVMLRDEPTR
jgi:cytochrome c5